MRESLTEILRQKVQEILPQVEVIVGWERGFNPLRRKPCFVDKSEEIDRLVWDLFCVQNLTGYLVKSILVPPKEEGKKIGICVRGCDSRSLVALIQEKFIRRDNIFIVGLPCAGTVDWRKVMKKISSYEVYSCKIEENLLLLETDKGECRLDVKEVLARRCLRCLYPNPVIYDIMIGSEIEPKIQPSELYEDLALFEQKSLEERIRFWKTELDRCLRCYACRNVCPLCVCQDRCIAETRDPKWTSQRADLKEKFMFHLIHAMHLAGRCTECGECERVCPVEIPVTLIKEKLNSITHELFAYEAGLDLEQVPPLLTFNPHDTGL